MRLYNEGFYEIRKKIIEPAQKNREADGNSYHDHGQTNRLLARRPIHVPQFLARFRKKFFDTGKHHGCLYQSFGEKARTTRS
jgi:hypothetical protein